MHTLKLKNRKKISIGITLGDPAGIGTEVVVKALAKTSIRNLVHFQIIGDKHLYQKYGGKKYSNISFSSGFDDTKKWALGQPTQKGGDTALKYLYKAVDLIKEKRISGLVTAPVCKEAIAEVDDSFIGHTEFFAKNFNIQNVGMMFVGKKLRTIIVTRHLPLVEVSQAVTKSSVYSTIELTHQALKKMFKIKNPCIAVCGLNPHAGENGRMGREEINVIIPAIKKACQNKMNVKGPFAADTLFSPDIAHKYDTVIAMYHDQGLIPIKTLCFKDLVNLTIGLPFVRTSPAHGTAFDIAGKNKADASSMCAAIQLAVKLSL